MDVTEPQDVYHGRERLSMSARTKRKRDAIQQVARFEAESSTVDMDEGEEDIEDEESPALVEEDEDDWDEDMLDDTTLHGIAVDYKMKTFVSLVESLVPRHGHFHETRGPTLGAD